MADLPTQKYFCPYSEQPMSVISDFLFHIFSVHIFRFSDFFLHMHHQSVKTKQCQSNFSIIHLVGTVCELTFSIIQTHYTWTTLFCLHLQKSLSIEDLRTLSPKTMHHVCCFRWCWRVLSWMVVFLVRVCFLGFVDSSSYSSVPAATSNRQLQTRHIGRWLTSTRFRCKVNVHWFNKLFGPISTSHILQPWKWFETCKCQRTITPHQRSMIGFAGNKLASFMSRFPYFLETVPIFWEIWAHIHWTGEGGEGGGVWEGW